MLLQMKIATIVATRYVFWDEGMPKCFCGWGLTALPKPPLLFVAIFKHCWLKTQSWKNAFAVLESPRILCNQESGNHVNCYIVLKLCDTVLCSVLLALRRKVGQFSRWLYMTSQSCLLVTL